ncbi:MAG: hypothetical protein AAF367_20720 [Pseudomonadota bacterium]
MQPIRSYLKAVLFAATAFSLNAASADAAGLRVRGEVVKIDGQMVSVEASTGQIVDVAMPEPVVLLYRDIKVEDIAPGAYIAAPTVAGADGTRRALGLVVFPEAMRGMNEGFKAWDLGTDSKMTNATVAQIVSRGGARVFTVTYGGEEQTVQVPTAAPVTTFAPSPGTPLDLGMNVVIFADETGGTISGQYVGIHENGSLPPL